ncbi:glycine zipper 2TM domain-containing protein [Nitratifractor sp.]
MKKGILASLAVAAMTLLFTGCGPTGPGVVSPEASSYVSTYDTGKITDIRYVRVQDTGAGTLVGAAIGAVLGHQIGHGHGRELATLGGGLVGAYVGNQVASANAQELTVRLTNGRRVVVVAKGTNFYVGEKVRIVRQGDRVVSVEPL